METQTLTGTGPRKLNKTEKRDLKALQLEQSQVQAQIEKLTAGTTKAATPVSSDGAGKPVPITVVINNTEPKPAPAATPAPVEKTVEAVAPVGTAIAKTAVEAVKATSENDGLVRAIGMIILASGMIGGIIYYFGKAEILSLLLYVALPLLGLGFALRLISGASIQLLWNGGLDKRVTAYVDELRGKKALAPVAA